MRPSALLTYKSTQEFLKTWEKCIEKHEEQPSASCTSWVFLKNPSCLYNSTVHEDKFFIPYYKMFKELHALWLVSSTLLQLRKARGLRYTRALSSYNARGFHHEFERA